MRDSTLRLLLTVLASGAYSFLVNGGVINSTLPANLAASGGPVYFAMLWVARDARKTGYWPAYHYGLFLVVLWFLAVLHDLVRTRGKRGFGPACGLLVLISLPLFAGAAGWAFYEDLPDFR